MLSVGLTGNVAAGKSRVAEVWRDHGVPVVGADDLAREVVAPGTPGLARVREALGDEVVAPDGSLDRAALRARVFADDEARRRLEEILHPLIQERRAAWLEARRAEGAALVVSEIPLLFEVGLDREVDVTVVVDAPEEERLRRLVEDRGLASGEARRIMGAQMDAAEKRGRADVVIGNDGTLEELDAEAARVLVELRERAGVDTLRMDLHLHTWGSWDCLSDPERVRRRLRELGFRRFAITDHDRMEVAREMADRYPGEVVVGEEVKTAEKIDVIGLHLTEAIPRGTPAHEVVDRIREQGGVSYLPHPYAGGKGGGGRYADELAARVDVVEVFNARMHPGRLNEPARELARRHGTLRGAGSDAHTVGELGGGWVELPDHPNTAGGLRAALRSAVTGGTTAPHWVHLASTWAKVRKKLPAAPGP